MGQPLTSQSLSDASISVFPRAVSSVPGRMWAMVITSSGSLHTAHAFQGEQVHTPLPRKTDFMWATQGIQPLGKIVQQQACGHCTHVEQQHLPTDTGRGNPAAVPLVFPWLPTTRPCVTPAMPGGISAPALLSGQR